MVLAEGTADYFCVSAVRVKPFSVDCTGNTGERHAIHWRADGSRMEARIKMPIQSSVKLSLVLMPQDHAAAVHTDAR